MSSSQVGGWEVDFYDRHPNGSSDSSSVSPPHPISTTRLSTPLTTILRAIMTCGLSMRAELFKPQEISMAVWAVGKLGLGLGGTAGATNCESSSGSHSRSHNGSDQSLASLSTLSSKFIGMLLPSALRLSPTLASQNP